MKLGRKKRAPRGPSEAAAARIGLKPSGGGKLKWIRVGFAWDLFVLSPLLGIPLFLRKLHQWGAAMLALLLVWFVLGTASSAARRRIWLAWSWPRCLS